MACRKNKKVFYSGYTFVHRGERWWDIYRESMLLTSRDTLADCKQYVNFKLLSTRAKQISFL